MSADPRPAVPRYRKQEKEVVARGHKWGSAQADLPRRNEGECVG